MTNSSQKSSIQTPEIPTETCPYINFVQSILDEIQDEVDSRFIELKISLINDLLEYIRESNDALRKSSNYWERQFLNKKK